MVLLLLSILLVGAYLPPVCRLTSRALFVLIRTVVPYALPAAIASPGSPVVPEEVKKNITSDIKHDTVENIIIYLINFRALGAQDFDSLSEYIHEDIPMIAPVIKIVITNQTNVGFPDNSFINTLAFS